MEGSDKWTELLEEGGYTIKWTADWLAIRRTREDYPELYLLMLLIAIPFAFFDYRIFLLVLVLMFVPFIYKKWKPAPSHIYFDLNGKAVSIEGNRRLLAHIDFNMIRDLIVEETELYGDANPFQEGNKDYIYNIKLITAFNKTHELMRLQFRRPQLKPMTAFCKEMKALIIERVDQ